MNAGKCIVFYDIRDPKRLRRMQKKARAGTGFDAGERFTPYLEGTTAPS